MDGGALYGAPDMLALLDSSTSLWAPSSSPFHETMMNFDHQEGHPMKRPSPFPGMLSRSRGGEGGDDIPPGGDDLEIGSHYHPEKKRRLSPEQVQFLERSFEEENKLEPERKVQLAKELGLQPRQVAIWFQNRRARYKTKQLEKDYEVLKSSYDRLKLDYDSLVKEKKDLQIEVKSLKLKLKQRDGNPNGSDLGLEETPRTEPEKASETEVRGATSTKQVEDASSAKSDVLDSESPLCAEANHPSLMEDLVDQPMGQKSVLSGGMLLPPPNTPPTFTNLLKGSEECFDPNGTCSFSLIEDQPPWAWLY